MQELITKANQAILESQYLRREGRLLRLQASVLATRLGQTMLQSQRAERDFAGLKADLDQALLDPADATGFSRP